MTLVESPPEEMKAFRSPGGRLVAMFVREGTADWNNVYSCLNEDEYHVRELSLTGWAADIGAHIGGVTMALLVDNPDLTVIAVEALTANVDLLRKNAEANGVSDRLVIVHSGATVEGRKEVTIEWGFDQTESGAHHRFIGNALGISHAGSQYETVPGVGLGDLVKMAGGEIGFMKIDCEGCEYDLLLSPAIAQVREIVGEFHLGIDRLIEILDPTHVVSLISGTEAFGGFRATRRE